MDLETENRIAAILLQEANELRRQAQSEGSLAYLRRPTTRSRPNSRFLTATVLGVQQANRAVEVNEMWRLRDKQIELDDRIRGPRSESRSRISYEESHRNRGSNEMEPSASPSHKSTKRITQDLHSRDDEGLKDDEIEKFLCSRRKRGRGAVGSRMDETGPYLPSFPGSSNLDEEWRKPRDFLGPEKPLWLKSESDDEYLQDEKEKLKLRSSKHHSTHKHKSKGKSKDKEKKKRTKEKEKKKRHHK